MKKIIITIDGYSSCGKSTLAKQLAKKLDYIYIDSGAMYRAVTLFFIRQDVNWRDEAEVKNALKDVHLEFVYNNNSGQAEMHLNDENVEHLIREMLVAEKVSEIAAIGAVRTFAVAQQQKMGARKGIVMDGRDIGTVVFPDAELKIFMTADPAVRVERRYKELYAKNPNITLHEVKENLELRDYIDANREISPLRRADDAIILDNSQLTMDEQLDLVSQWVEDAIMAHSS
ncbi:(d)CMP kinase [Chitinophaga horti]|uniref:Cytidylate kinase n=1 Tax=Chitinophaga horti TaxID=2920382 RepID=A0ABY6IZ42_9BACT|nr:(d)CMP kinase [Chitinophaga horti]UYQ91672.1 (d)CMP kinase [Chitinophaga horti]